MKVITLIAILLLLACPQVHATEVTLTHRAAIQTLDAADHPVGVKMQEAGTRFAFLSTTGNHLVVQDASGTKFLVNTQDTDYTASNAPSLTTTAIGNALTQISEHTDNAAQPAVSLTPDERSRYAKARAAVVSPQVNSVLYAKEVMLQADLAVAASLQQPQKPTVLQRELELRTEVEAAMVAADPSIAELVAKYDKAHPIVATPAGPNPAFAAMLENLVLTARYHQWEAPRRSRLYFAGKVNVDNYQKALLDTAKAEYDKISPADQQSIVQFLNSPAAKYLTDIEKVSIMVGPDDAPHPIHSTGGDDIRAVLAKVKLPETSANIFAEMDQQITSASIAGDYDGAEAVDPNDQNALERGRDTANAQLSDTVKADQTARSPLLTDAYVEVIQGIADQNQKKQLLDFMNSEAGTAYFNYRNAVTQKMANTILADACPIDRAAHAEWGSTNEHTRMVVNSNRADHSE